jgi:Lon protease-like protein
MFCVAPMKPGLSEAHSADDFHHVVGLGLVRACVGHGDGTSHLVLQGLARVRITDFLQETPFRLAEIQELASLPVDEQFGEDLIAVLLKTCAHLRARGVPVPEALDQHLAHIEDLAVLSDVIAYTFLRDPERRRAVFEELHVARRTQLLIRHLLEESPDSEGPV